MTICTDLTLTELILFHPHCTCTKVRVQLLKAIKNIDLDLIMNFYHSSVDGSNAKTIQ